MAGIGINIGRSTLDDFFKTDEGRKTEEGLAGYKAGLQVFVDMMIEKSSKDKLIFVTPPVQRRYYSDGTFNDALSIVTNAMIEVAEANDVAVVDLHAKTLEWILSITEEDAASYFMPGDPQHHNRKGSKLMCEFIAELIEEQNHPLAVYFK